MSNAESCGVIEGCVSSADRDILRKLAREVKEYSEDSLQQRRIELWKNHNSLRQPSRPILYISPEGSWGELIPSRYMLCSGEIARGIEWNLRMIIYGHEHFRHDVPVTAEYNVQRDIRSTGWGLEVLRTPSKSKGGSWHHVQNLHSIDDVDKINIPVISENIEGSQRRCALVEDVLGDILNIKLVGIKHISFHLMKQYTDWRGLEESLYDMYEEPELLHAVMSRLTEGHLSELRQYEQQGLLDLNSDGTYHNSGGFGWSHELPTTQDGGMGGAKLCDMWGSAESQEMSSVGPQQHKEFVLNYENRLLEPFGLTGYGCCEDLTQKLDDVFAIPHIRRISISPWADVDVCAPRLAKGYIFSWKPNPAMLVGEFREKYIRGYLRHTIEVCADNGCFLEIILKDTHTCEKNPERFDNWARIAREEISRVYPQSVFE